MKTIHEYIADAQAGKLEPLKNIVKGDRILFCEDVFSGSFKNPKHIGQRYILADVIKESYGEKTAQHTFTLEILDACGIEADSVLSKRKTTRKGRNIYKQCFVISEASDKQAQTKDKNERKAQAQETKINRLLGY